MERGGQGGEGERSAGRRGREEGREGERRAGSKKGGVEMWKEEGGLKECFCVCG
jgi:hypothetical protein